MANTIGILADPEFPTEVAKHLEKELPIFLKEYVDKDISWQVEMITNEIVSVAEDNNQLLDNIQKMQSKYDWHYTLCLTDLPTFDEKEIRLAQVDFKHQMAYISLPALGWFTKKRITKLAGHIFIDLYFNPTDNKDKNHIRYPKQIFLFNKIKKKPSSDHRTHVVEYILSPRFFGYITVLSGMTHNNQPWTIMPSLKNVIAIAFGSGAYGMIFPTLWQLSYEYSALRLIAFTLLSIISLTLWIIQGHNLWEKPNLSKSQNYRNLYNTATFITLLLAVGLFYIVLIFFFIIAALIIVEPRYFAQQLSLSTEPTFFHYLQLAWLTTSVGTLTGAIGAILEDEENVRQSTYGYRQRSRLDALKRRKDEAEE